VRCEVRITNLRLDFLPYQEVRSWFDEFAQWHGGSIKVASQMGRGTTFTASLPVRQQ